MPDYCYHISIEVLQDAAFNQSSLEQLQSNLSPFTTNTRRNPSLSNYVDRVIERAPAHSNDRRIDELSLEDPLMDDISTGIGTSISNLKTRAHFQEIVGGGQIPSGIVHLYRETDETPGLTLRQSTNSGGEIWNGSAPVRPASLPSSTKSPKPAECSMLAILAVPSYLTPKDFLAFVGEPTVNAVSHFRLIKTARLNRYMVLMKFKDARFARQWQNDWNGRVFNSMEPETCHVVFVRSVDIVESTAYHDGQNGQLGEENRASKPLPPPTPTLIELPTCPVCLERMDESTGLLTILCQHVFHCSCLEKWSGGGCPVCRFSQDDFSSTSKQSRSKKAGPNADGEYDLSEENMSCESCHTTESLWQCLLCGEIGCGRYKAKHAYKHYETTGHAFSVDLDTQRVWDYDRDCYVHRIIANGSSASEKLVELPGRARDGHPSALQDLDQDLDIAKRENLAFEYTQLLTSQLESQREYFEESLKRAADKASEAAKKAEVAAHQRDEVTERSSKEHTALQKALDKAKAEAQKLKGKLAEVQKNLAEEKAIGQSMLESSAARDKTSETSAETVRNLRKQVQDLEQQDLTKDFLIQDLQEQNRDLRFRFEATSKLKELVDSGVLTQEEADGASIEVRPHAVSQPDIGSTSNKPKKRTKKKKSVVVSVADVDADLSQQSCSSLQDQPLPLDIWKDYKLADNSPARAVQLLLEHGIIEKREEVGLYE